MRLSAKTLPKRWIVFGFVWLFVFAIAPLRTLMLAQMQQTIWSLPTLASVVKERESFTELLAEHPSDARVWSAAADEAIPSDVSEYDLSDPQTRRIPTSSFFLGKPDKEFRAEQRRRLDIAIEKFPDQPWLIAKRLKNSWGYMYGDRIGGELSDWNLAANKAAGIPSPERQKIDAAHPYSYPNFKLQELQRVLQLCTRGQKLEPKNAYYDWTRAYFLALAWRDEEAWQALDAAAQKPDYDEHQLEELRARIAAREIKLRRPVLWEEKAMMAQSTLFPQFARYREFARIVSWELIKAQRRGDHAQALRLIGSFAKVAAKMRENSKFVIERSVATALEIIVVISATYDARKGLAPPAWRKGTPAQQTIARYNSTSSYAIAHGRRDLADWLAKDSSKAAAARAQFISVSLAGTPFRDAALIVLLWQIGALILMTLPLCLVARIVSRWISKIPRLRKLLHCNTPILFESEKIAPRDILGATLACGGLNLVAYAVLGVLVATLTAGFIAAGFGQLGAMQNNLSNFWNPFLTTIGIRSSGAGAPSIWESLFYTFSNFDAFLNNEAADVFYSQSTMWILALLPIVFGALWCTKIAVARQCVWQKISGGENITDKRNALAILRALIRQHTAPNEATRFITAPLLAFDVVPFFVTMFRALAWGVFYGMWLLAAFSNGVNLYTLLAIAVLIGGGLWLDLFWRWKQRRGTFNHRRRAARFGLRLMRESWLGWLALGSGAFLLTLLLAWPLRSHADAQIARYLTLGEIATLE
jgi:hypothetical protein